MINKRNKNQRWRVVLARYKNMRTWFPAVLDTELNIVFPSSSLSKARNIRWKLVEGSLEDNRLFWRWHHEVETMTLQQGFGRKCLSCGGTRDL